MVMVSITVDNFKDKESVPIYQLADESSVLDLKAEIEATEGIPIGHQRLVYCSRDLRDDENLDFLIHCGQNNESLIHLHQLETRIYLHFFRELLSEESPDRYPEETFHIDVDLDKPIYSSLPWGSMQEFGKTVDSFSVESGTISLLDHSKPLSYYGIRNGNTIDIAFGTSGGTPSSLNLSSIGSRHRLASYYRSLLSTSTIPHPFVVKAKYDWDGKIMHPYIQGLPLERDALFKVTQTVPGSPQWLFGFSLASLSAATLAISKSPPWSRLPFFSGMGPRAVGGYFPESFVSPFEESTDEDLATADGSEVLDVPPLPPFPFPPVDRMTFNMPISDKGHSFLKITANYELLSSPVDPTHVTITLLCCTHDIRRISSISLFLEAPETTVLDVKVCENEAHREEIHVDKEVTESRSRQTHFDGMNIGANGTAVGFQGGISRGYSIGSTEKGSRVSRRKVDARVYNDHTVFWSLKAPTTRLDEDGLTGEESITFILTKKPVRFRYKCRVTHSRDGVEKTLQRESKP